MLLRIAHRSQPPPRPEPRVIGVDDFAFRRGVNYGTLIVDLERSAVVDVLPDRNAITLKAWLEQHPKLEIVTRDRSSEYTRAITEGAPEATQVLDRFLLTRQHLTGCSRWHVLKNVREALERFLVRFRKPIAEIARGFEDHRVPRVQRTNREAALSREAHTRRIERIRKVRAALEQGKTIVEIAHELRVSKWFVRCCARSEELPEPRRNARTPSILEPFVDQLEALWSAGSRNAMQFWRDLKNAGFTGSYKRVHQWVQAKRVRSMATGTVVEARLEASGNTEASATDKKPARVRSFVPKQLAWLLMREDESLEDKDKHVLA